MTGAALICAIGLGLVAGFVDAVGFLRWQAFGANMTGNTVLLGIALFRDPAAAIPIFVPIAGFVAGSLAGRLAIERVAPAVPLVVAALLLAGIAPLRVYAWQVGLIAFTMGLQNMSVSTFSGVRANTTFITGDYSSVARALAEIVLGRDREQNWRAVAVLAPLIGGYALGAFCGAGASALIAWPLLAIVPVVFVLALVVYRDAVR